MVDNPEAFPNSTGVRCFSTGMTLRDYFAAAALTGWLTTDHFALEYGAKACFEWADAMLAECAKETNEKRT